MPMLNPNGNVHLDNGKQSADLMYLVCDRIFFGINQRQQFLMKTEIILVKKNKNIDDNH